MAVEKKILYGKTLSELELISKELGFLSFTGKQIAEWLYKKDVVEIDQMTNISKKNRMILEELYSVGLSTYSDVKESIDGTKKYLFDTGNGHFVETAYIPEEDRATLCISSQMGCRMGCKFCMTAKQGFQTNLTCFEILNQFRSVPEFKSLTNIVYMGMGEPMDNIEEVLKSIEIMTSDWGYGWSPKRITVSTVGIIPGLKLFMDESKAHLAISLHNPFYEERKDMMPVEKMYGLKDVIDLLRKYDFSGQRRVSFEYIMFEGKNDTTRHVNELARLLNGLECRVNLIGFHPVPGSEFVGSKPEVINIFKDKLNKKGIIATVRKSRGMDIDAACGLLSTLNKL